MRSLSTFFYTLEDIFRRPKAEKQTAIAVCFSA